MFESRYHIVKWFTDRTKNNKLTRATLFGVGKNQVEPSVSSVVRASESRVWGPGFESPMRQRLEL